MHYKGRAIGQYYADLLVDEVVICEIKATEALMPAHEAQLLHYLKANGIKVNFGGRRLQVKRMVF